MLSSREYAINVRNTAAFIAADRTIVQPVRTTQLPDGAGGFSTVEEQVLDGVPVRLIPSGRQTTAAAEELSTTDGRRIVTSYVLMAMPDCGLQRYDRFVVDGQELSISAVHSTPSYEFKADVVLYAE